MGVKFSKKKTTKKGKDDKKKAKKKDYGKPGTPEALRKEITDIYEEFKGDKKMIEPLYYEKVGLTSMLNEEREKLLNLLAVMEKLKKDRDPLMTACWEADADEIRRAFTKNLQTDKSLLVNVMACRTKWQLIHISEIYEKKYGLSLLQQLVNDLTTFIGGIFSGKITELCNLLTYRMLPTKERDAAFLRDFTDGYVYLDDEDFIEVVATRNNSMLREAVDQYLDEYGKHLTDIVKAKTSNRYYRELLLKLLECNRDEDMEPFDEATATKLAKELYEAGAARVVGVDPEPFIRILSTINHVQFESINAHYKNNELLEDIGKKFSADFHKAATALCTDKYDFLAARLEKFFRSYGSNKDGICRILGSLSRWECAEVRKRFDKAGGSKKTLEVAIKNNVKDKHYQQALLLLISGDLSQAPMASDREEGEDEAEVIKEGDRARKLAEDAYNSKKTAERGKQHSKAKKKGHAGGGAKTPGRKKHGKKGDDDDEEDGDGDGDGEKDGGGEREGGDEESKHFVAEEADELDDDDIPKFYWDGKGRFMDKEKLKVGRRALFP